MAAPQTSRTILLVEDEEPLRRLVQVALEARGYRVLCAADPEQALHLCRQFPEDIHLCLTDVTLRGRSGCDLVVQIAELRPNIRTLYMSGYPLLTGHPGVPPVQPAGIEFLAKPFGLDELAERVRRVLTT